MSDENNVLTRADLDQAVELILREISLSREETSRLFVRETPRQGD